MFKQIYGTIGYSFYTNGVNNIVVFADMHDVLPDCEYDYIKLTTWLEKNMKKCKILIEEIPLYYDDKLKIIDIWNKSEHVKDTRNLYLLNSKYIEAIDIRYYLIPFSSNIIDNTSKYNIVYKEYIKDLINFFINKKIYYNDKVIIELNNLNGENEKYFNEIKNKFINNIYIYILLDKTTLYIKNNFNYIYDKINSILDDCIEFYSCYIIDINKEKFKNIILYAGLYHTTKINDKLINLYNYRIIKNIGMTHIDNVPDYSCKKFIPELNL